LINEFEPNGSEGLELSSLWRGIHFLRSEWHSYEMDIGDCEFDFVSQIEAERDSAGVIVFWTPPSRYYKDDRPLAGYGHGPFIRLNLGSVPASPGVYAIIKNDEEVMYVGGTTDSLANRWGSGVGFASISPSGPFRNGTPTFCRVNCRIGYELEIGSKLSLWALLTNNSRGVKKVIIGKRLPPWNKNY
jgi:hypothetical protein